MKSEYAARPTVGALAGTAINTTTAATAVQVVNPLGVSRYLFFSSTCDKAINITIKYPGEAVQDLMEIPGTTTAITIAMTLGASDIRLAPSVTIGAYAAAAPTAGRLSISCI